MEPHLRCSGYFAGAPWATLELIVSPQKEALFFHSSENTRPCSGNSSNPWKHKGDDITCQYVNRWPGWKSLPIRVVGPFFGINGSEVFEQKILCWGPLSHGWSHPGSAHSATDGTHHRKSSALAGSQQHFLHPHFGTRGDEMQGFLCGQCANDERFNRQKWGPKNCTDRMKQEFWWIGHDLEGANTVPRIEHRQSRLETRLQKNNRKLLKRGSFGRIQLVAATM